MNKFLFSILLTLTHSVAHAEPVLVTASDTAVETLTKSQAKRIMGGQTASWPDGTPVQLILPPKKSAEAVWISKSVVKIPEDVYRRYLLEKAFAAIIPQPIQANTTSEISAELHQQAHSVGVLQREDVGEGLKIIQIE